ncbi:MAG TPA: Do family serine endopeptidase [Bryobacteraceae bacterium]|nr:Do family serine endopeptidase [Bryobacteraceae bacterium]
MSIPEKFRTEKLLTVTLLALTLCVGIVIGTLVSTGFGVRAARGGQAAPGATPLVIPNPVELSTQFSQIAKQVEPSVVHITVKYLPQAPAQTRRRRGAQAPPQGDEGDQGDSGNGFEQFFQFFGNPFGGDTPDMPGAQGGEALGSGVVVDRAGYVLTNNHVVDKADSIKVKFTGDSQSYDAKVVGVDDQTDLAVIHVIGKADLVPAKIGNSDGVHVGDWAVAIGSPFDFQNTVTAGIISATGRDLDPEHQYQHFLQTDAAINPGNSGGPLLNIRGEVIGINTAIASTSRGYQGIGFALPINTAAGVYNQIIKNGKVTRGSIGVTYPSDESQSQANLAVAHVSEGVFVESVQSGGPSEKAGIEAGDVIVSIDGRSIHDGTDLVNHIVNTPIGTVVTLGVIRDGKRSDYKVTVGDLTQVFADRFGAGSSQPNATKTPEGQTTSAKFGMTLQNITDQKRTQLGIKQSGGIQVISVQPNSFAEEVGLLPDDVILSINRQEVSSRADVARIEGTLAAGQAVQFRLLRRSDRGSNQWLPMFLAGMLPTSGQ